MAGVVKSSASSIDPIPTAPPTPFEPLRVMSNFSENNFSGFDAKSTTITDSGNKALESLTLDDKIMGYAEGKTDYFSIKSIDKQEVNCLEIQFENDALIVSKYSCVFSDALGNFCYAYQLKAGDYLLCNSENKKIKSIKSSDKKELYAVQLHDRGCYFVDTILVHSQDTLPRYAFYVAKEKNISKINKEELTKLIKTHTKNIFPSWRYEKSNNWKKAHYLSDLNIAEREVGYLFSNKMKIHTKLNFDLKQFVNGYILIKIVGLDNSIDGQFENVKIDASEYEKFSINDEEYIFLSLSRYQSSKKISSFDFVFACEKENLLVNLNVINDLEYECLQNFFKVD
jgi:hypothetical protein